MKEDAAINVRPQGEWKNCENREVVRREDSQRPGTLQTVKKNVLIRLKKTLKSMAKEIILTSWENRSD